MGGGGRNELALAELAPFDADDKPKKSAFNSVDGNGTTRNSFHEIEI